jgi:hypothetical protein
MMKEEDIKQSVRDFLSNPKRIKIVEKFAEINTNATKELEELQMELAHIFCSQPLELGGNTNPTKEQILLWREQQMDGNKIINDALQKGFDLLRNRYNKEMDSN